MNNLTATIYDIRVERAKRGGLPRHKKLGRLARDITEIDGKKIAWFHKCTVLGLEGLIPIGESCRWCNATQHDLKPPPSAA